MALGLDLSVWTPRSRSGAPAAPPPPVSDPKLIAVGPEGWRATYQDPVAFDPVADPRPVAVTRPGFGADGAPATVDETLTIMARVRQPYPNQASPTADEVALSDYVYQGDQVAGAANQSAQPYPAPQALWLNHDLEVATGPVHRVRLAVAHAHARRGRPVAAVRFIATDGVNTAETLVTGMDVISYPATGLAVPHFAADLDLSGLAAGALITVDAEIRPWIGPAFVISADGDPYPSANLTVLKVLNDRDGSYGTTYAYVDPVAGDNVTGIASADPAVARANPFATIAGTGAITKINARNSAEFGRTGLSGGIIRLEPGVHTHQGFGWYQVTEVPLVIEAADPAQRAATIFQDAGASVSNGLPDKLVLRNLTLRRNASGNVIFLDSQALAGSENMLAVDSCIWDGNGYGAPWTAWVYRVGRFWIVNSDGENLNQCRQFSTDFKACICIGSGAGSLQDFTYHAVACRDLSAQVETNLVQGNVPAPRGDFFGWNHFGQPVAGVRCLFLTKDREIDARGVAVIGNVFEHYGGTTGPVVSLSADGAVLPARNVTMMCNTTIGSRTNFLYQDAGTVRVEKQGRCRFNVDYLWNSKDDTFLPADGNRTGNWAVQYRVGFRANAALEGSNNGAEFAPGDAWLGEVAALGDVTGAPDAPLAADWLDDQSFGAGGAGGGDYRPGPAHALPRIPAGLAPYAADQRGAAIADDGTAVAGALQP